MNQAPSRPSDHLHGLVSGCRREKVIHRVGNESIDVVLMHRNDSPQRSRAGVKDSNRPFRCPDCYECVSRVPSHGYCVRTESFGTHRARSTFCFPDANTLVTRSRSEAVSGGVECKPVDEVRMADEGSNQLLGFKIPQHYSPIEARRRYQRPERVTNEIENPVTVASKTAHERSGGREDERRSGKTIDDHS